MTRIARYSRNNCGHFLANSGGIRDPRAVGGEARPGAERGSAGFAAGAPLPRRGLPVLRIRMQDGCSAAKPIDSQTGADARIREPPPGGCPERTMGDGLAAFTHPTARFGSLRPSYGELATYDYELQSVTRTALSGEVTDWEGGVATKTGALEGLLSASVTVTAVSAGIGSHRHT